MIRQSVRGPKIRLRRLRASEARRALVREHHVMVERLVQPIFIVEDERAAGPIASLPGISRLTVPQAVTYARRLQQMKIGAVMLFGLPAHKDPIASSNYEPQGVVQRTIREIKAAVPELLVCADLCNCEYTDHGHCGLLDARGDVDNDRTVEVLVRTALTYAASGADVIAPSDMMDGRVGAIRDALDEENFLQVAILSYAAKYASAFYGPFREAAGCAPQFGDRRTYQMDPPNVREAMREIELDIREGADVVMIKPALSYLDVIRAARERFDVPIAAFNVSGEYAMLHAAASNGWLDLPRAVDEVLASITRAGADLIVTYFAQEYAERNG
ncbi:MAG: porphobilinogen synthase [Candidatus Eremiobacteraeota bacterium]|nr:porphobilinogen synthase [Candidatus Eremiobacteraeota bacterium]